MALHAVVGLQFGDEGKGKFVDYLARSLRHVARFSGGANAGHTVQVDGSRQVYSQLPAVSKPSNLYVCPGAVISPDVMLREIDLVLTNSPDTRIVIDPRCHIVLPLHVAINAASERFKGKDKIGSVGKGIGAAVEDRTNRLGIRVFDALDRSRLSSRMALLTSVRNKQLQCVYGADNAPDVASMIDNISDFGRRIRSYVGFTDEHIRNCLSEGHDVLLETSQATFLDNIYGTYPYTVSYNTLVQNSLPIIGIPAQAIQTLGVMKCYSIRVGNGPFPTEMDESIASNIRHRGNEFGSVSGRPRRCGWLDLSLIKRAVELNGVTRIALTNVDVLGGHVEIAVAVGYTINGERVSTSQALLQFDDVTPVYEYFNGWPEIDSITSSANDIPAELRSSIKFIEDFVGCPVQYLSYGPDRQHTLEVAAA